MDKWSDDQLKKMELGGNIKAREFFEDSPDYFQGMSIKEKYSSVFATQYKEKVSKKNGRGLHGGEVGREGPCSLLCSRDQQSPVKLHPMIG